MVCTMDMSDCGTSTTLLQLNNATMTVVKRNVVQHSVWQL